MHISILSTVVLLSTCVAAIESPHKRAALHKKPTLPKPILARDAQPQVEKRASQYLNSKSSSKRGTKDRFESSQLT